MTTRHAVSASNRNALAHTHTPRMNFNTDTETHNELLIGTHSRNGVTVASR